MHTTKSKVVFKDYNYNQNLLLPPSLEELIEENHPVRVLNEIIDHIDIEPLLQRFKGGGTSSYHPRMMLKILIYGYLRNQYSSRKIEQSLHDNIHFMWLSGMSYPDHNTINRFRSERLHGILQQIFKQVALLLVEAGHISLKEAVYIDGTKIEANANRYTFVWGRSIKTNREKIKQQLKELWDYAESVAKEELENNEPESFEQIDAKKVRQTIDTIDNALLGKPIDKKKKQKLNYARKNWPQALDKYDEQEKLMGERNSMSKTDPDATFMRMKEDHMKNGQLKPGYNIQISTQEQFILAYSAHQTSTDTTTLPIHMDLFEQIWEEKPQALVGDAGYGSEENYEYLQDNDIEAFVKYSYFHKEQTKKWKEDPHRIGNLHYNQEQDCFYCPMGQPMRPVNETINITDNGYEQTIRHYQAVNCKGCPMRGVCHKAKGNRVIQVSPKLYKHKAIAREKLNSEQGLKHRSQRPVDVEAVFGMIKSNRNFKRFMLRGMEKVEIELGLLSIAHNILKMAG